ncbi:extracellular elastinolytic metalloproteinase [Coprinopsis cinerea AmutBmut pab1-1]|nr:extracellular elastinolytic metalloproteinase [Coprinopsis cinerea AmutBmut pab1-1]
MNEEEGSKREQALASSAAPSETYVISDKSRSGPVKAGAPLLINRPTSLQFPDVAARDAWIQADVDRCGGANRCLLWSVFASRGLGLNAAPAQYVNDFDVPQDCQE